MPDKKYKWSKENAFHVLKVFGWSAGSAVIGVTIATISGIEFPKEWMFLVPVVNSLLVALQEFINEKR